MWWASAGVGECLFCVAYINADWGPWHCHLYQDAMEQLLRTVEAKGFLDVHRAKEAGFCPLRFIAEYLMRHNPKHAAAAGVVA